MPIPQALDDPYWLYQEVLRLRELLQLVAGELEVLAAAEPDPRRRAALLRRAMRIRARSVAGTGSDSK